MQPILALDVDGPLNPDWVPGHAPAEGFVSYRWKNETRRSNGSVRYQRLPRVWLNAGHGPQLLALEAELAWGTSWNNLANRFIGPAIGLPVLPVVHVGEPAWTERPGGLHWKIPALAEFRPTQPLLWVDDECTKADARELARLRRAPTAIYRVDLRTGLTVDDFRSIAELLRTLEQQHQEDLC